MSDERENALRSELHRKCGDIIDYARDLVRYGSYGPLIEELPEVVKKLDSIRDTVFLLTDDVKRFQQLATLPEDERGDR